MSDGDEVKYGFDPLDPDSNFKVFWNEVLFPSLVTLGIISSLITSVYIYRRLRKRKLQKKGETINQLIKEFIAISPVIKPSLFEHFVHSHQLSTIDLLRSDFFKAKFLSLPNNFFLNLKYFTQIQNEYSLIDARGFFIALTENIGPQWTADQWRSLLNESHSIQIAMRSLIQYVYDNDKFPSSEELFLLGVSIKHIDVAVALANLEFNHLINFDDFQKSNLQFIDTQSLKALKKHSLSEWSVKQLYLDSQIPFFIAKILPSYANWVFSINPEIFLRQEIFNSDDWDKLALKVVNYKEINLGSIAIDALALVLKKGLLETRLILFFTETSLLRETTLPDSSSSEYLQIESRARQIGLAKKKRIIKSGVDIIENITTLKWDSLSAALEATYFYSQKVLNRPIQSIGQISDLKEEKISIERDTILKVPKDTRKITEYIHDLKTGKAILLTTLVSYLKCKELNLPSKLKELIGEAQDPYSLIFRSGFILLEPSPPSKASCQLCGGGYIEETPFMQCMDCNRYVCTPHYLDLKAVGSEKCPNCGGRLFLFPFSCDGCKLDFNSTQDLGSKIDRCSLCNYPLISQTELLKQRIGEVGVKEVLIDDYYSDMKEGKNGS